MIPHEIAHYIHQPFGDEVNRVGIDFDISQATDPFMEAPHTDPARDKGTHFPLKKPYRLCPFLSFDFSVIINQNYTEKFAVRFCAMCDVQSPLPSAGVWWGY